MKQYRVSINGLPLVRRQYSRGYTTGDRHDVGATFASREAATEAALSLFPNSFYGPPTEAIRVHYGIGSDRADSARYMGIDGES